MTEPTRYLKDDEVKAEWKALRIAIIALSVVVASLKTPFYAFSHDDGKIEIIRANVEKNYFQLGMWLIALGFFLQAFGTLL